MEEKRRILKNKEVYVTALFFGLAIALLLSVHHGKQEILLGAEQCTVVKEILLNGVFMPLLITGYAFIFETCFNKGCRAKNMGTGLTILAVLVTLTIIEFIMYFPL